MSSSSAPPPTAASTRGTGQHNIPPPLFSYTQLERNPRSLRWNYLYSSYRTNSGDGRPSSAASGLNILSWLRQRDEGSRCCTQLHLTHAVVPNSRPINRPPWVYRCCRPASPDLWLAFAFHHTSCRFQERPLITECLTRPILGDGDLREIIKASLDESRDPNAHGFWAAPDDILFESPLSAPAVPRPPDRTKSARGRKRTPLGGELRRSSRIRAAVARRRARAQLDGVALLPPPAAVAAAPRQLRHLREVRPDAAPALPGEEEADPPPP